MITKIHLNNFGRFRGVSYELAQTTIFFGPNEAGKTTIFDAIALEIAEKGKGKATGFLEEAKKRYGAKKNVVIEMLPPVKMDYGKFANFFAIRSSRTEVQFGDEKRWEKEMRSRLLFGGFDMVELKNRFKILAETNQKDSYNRQIKEITDNLLKLVETLEVSKNELRDYASLVNELFATEKKLQQLEEKIAVKENDNREFQKSLQEIEKELEGFYYQMWEDSYIRYKPIEEMIARLPRGLEEERLVEFRQRQEKLRQKEEELRQEEKEIDFLRIQWERIQIKTEGIIQHRQENEQKRQAKRKAALLWKIIGVLFLIISFGGALVSWVMQLAPWYIWGIGGALFFLLGLGVELVGFFSFREKEDALMVEEQKNLYNEALHVGLKSWPSSWENFVKMMDELSAQWKEKLSQYEKKREIKEREREQLERDIQKFCEDSGVNSLAEAMALIEQRKGLEAKKEGLLLALNNHVWREPHLSLEENNQRILQRIGKNFLKTEGSFQNLEQKRRVLLQNSERIREEIQHLLRQKSDIKEYVGKLRQQLIQKEEMMQEYERLVREKQKLEKKRSLFVQELEATRKVLQILDQIETEQASVFQRLSMQVRDEFGEVFLPFQEIHVEGFSSESMFLPDVGGETRSLVFLSRGTQDIFYLALRLFLGKQMWDDNHVPGFFIFDEPFASLDKERMGIALQMLKRFQEKYQWQYIFFTKDEQLVQMIQEEKWPYVVVHELKRAT